MRRKKNSRNRRRRQQPQQQQQFEPQQPQQQQYGYYQQQPQYIDQGYDQEIFQGQGEMQLIQQNQQLPQQTSQSFKSQNEPQGSEQVKVAVRIRPMLPFELKRGDTQCVKVIDEKQLQLHNKGVTKHYRFNAVLNSDASQEEVFYRTNIDQLLESALDGYSTTFFAYGQTGSGKTYSMAGVEEKLGQEHYIADDTEGIIPRGVQYLWQAMSQREEQFYVKSSYMEIYNEQIQDLLNPQSGVLHTRWNSKNGFFVEDLLIVECTSVDDLIAVLHEGMKNRKSGSHQLNADSSRSHSILTVYLITQVNTEEGQIIKKYGKVSFVDLAGSERLKESKSKGVMIKETGKINKSLFTLGKVITTLADRKKSNAYIPYRDSKLTMLLMDSLGGSSKALMIACCSPSGTYYDETLSTLNYATRTMNIKNKPVIQMDPKEQIIFNLKKENQLLKLENKYLKEQLQRVSDGLPIEIPDFLPVEGKQKKISRSKRNKRKQFQQQQQQPQLQPQPQDMQIPLNKIVTEYQLELSRLKQDNNELRNARDIAEKNYHIAMNDNNALNIKLENLENIFIGTPVSKSQSQKSNKSKMGEEYMTSNLLYENTGLKKRIQELTAKNMSLQQMLNKGGDYKSRSRIASGGMRSLEDAQDLIMVNQQNAELQQRVEFLQKRERELANELMKKKK